MTAAILGIEYSISYKEQKEEKELEENDGYCDSTSKEIVIVEGNPNHVGNFAELQKRVLRHEILHAFLYESGLGANFEHTNQFGHDETMVDWISLQFPKILKVYWEVGAL